MFTEKNGVNNSRATKLVQKRTGLTVNGTQFTYGKKTGETAKGLMYVINNFGKSDRSLAIVKQCNSM